MDQDATWYGGRPRSRAHCVRRGPSSPPKKWHSSPQFSAHVCCGQTAGSIKMPPGRGVDFGPGHSVRWTPSPPRKGHSSSPSFRPMSTVAKRSSISTTAQLLLQKLLPMYRIWSAYLDAFQFQRWQRVSRYRKRVVKALAMVQLDSFHSHCIQR